MSIYDHTSATHAQAFYLLCGKELGRGMSRVVYECKINPNLVVKIEETSGQFQNVVEWETWKRVANTPFSRWFARPHWISDNSAIMLMERTMPASGEQFADRMPMFLCDFKRTNFGMVGKWLVCHDYGTNLLFEYGMTKRMKKVSWYDAE